MQIINPNIKIDFMGRKNLFALISVLGVVASIILVIYPGPKYGIDFSGGTQVLIPFGEGVEIGRIRGALTKSGFDNAEVVRYGTEDNRFLITVQQTSPVSDEMVEQVKAEVSGRFSAQGVIDDSFRFSASGDQLTVRFGEEIDVALFEKTLRDTGVQVRAHRDRDDEVTQTQDGADVHACDAPVCRLLPLNEFKYEANLVGISGLVLQGLRDDLGADNVSDPDHTIYVGPKVGDQLKTAGIMSLVYALGFIMLYIAVRFDLRFAPGAVVALIHDVIITLGIFVIIRHEVSLPIIAAMLTIIGYSLNDTIVVFDRIRENFQKLRERDISLVVNQSINETLSRTLLTSFTTLITVFAIYIFGGGLIRDFALALIIGIFVGTYSSIYIASPVAIFLDKRFFHKQAAG